MSHPDIEELVRALLDEKVALPEDLKGCTAEEVESVRTFAGGAIPPVYEAFLRRMGRGAGAYSGDVDMFFPRIMALREPAQELLGSVGRLLPPEWFVFSMLNECAFLCFDARLADPVVQRYVEGDRGLTERDTLSAYFRSETARLRQGGTR